MKWGVRRSDAELARASGRVASDDAKEFDRAQSKIAVGGTRALSNRELQNVINRMNLERQYHTMTQQHQDSLDVGLAATKRVLKVGKTIEDVRKFLDTPTGRAVKTGVMGAAAAAAAYATGGASSAAGAGVSVVLRNRQRNHYTNVGN